MAQERPTRPQVQHGATAPDLVRYLAGEDANIDNTFDEDKDNSDKKQGDGTYHEAHKSAEELFQSLRNRQNTDYKSVVFEMNQPLQGVQFEQRVSFDTINIQAAEDPSLNFLDEEQKIEYLSTRRRLSASTEDNRGRGFDRDHISLRSGSSPSGSPTRMVSPLRSNNVSSFFTRAQVRYPTVPILTRKCCTLTRIHKDYEDLYLGNLADQGLSPTLSGRVIMVYVSGRKHTWVAIDWVLCNFVQHGDTVVIVSSIPHSLGPMGSALTKYQSPQSYPPQTGKVRQRQRNRPEYIKQIAANIMTYAQSVVNHKAIVKLTVEIAEGKTKDVLKDMYKLYEPNIVSTGSKSSTKNSAPLKSWNSSRLSDRLVKLFPLPVVVVPAPNMGAFEQKLSMALSGKESPVFSSRGGSSETSPEEESSALSSSQSGDYHSQDEESDMESLSDQSLHSESSTDSESSARSYTSFDEISELYTDYKKSMTSRLGKYKAREVDENYFANFIKTISDSSLQFCEDLKDVNPDFRGQGAKLAREITGSNQFGAVPYKTKSLLPPVEKTLSTGTSGTVGGMSYTELKRSLQNNAKRASEAGPTPTIRIDSPTSPLQAPKASALKFEEAEKPNRRNKMTKLQKFLSHEDPASRKMDLEPSKSQPDLTQTFNSTEKSKKTKRNKFWKLLKRQAPEA